VQAREALSHAQEAVELEKVNTEFNTEARNLNLSESLATLAWAKAVNSAEPVDVVGLIDKALALCPETTVPVRAQVLYHAGRGYTELGKIEESIREFQDAARLDSKGNYVRLAKAALQKALGR
jgi:hypothetical protein